MRAQEAAVLTLIVFRGPFDAWHRTDATGFNCVGYVTRNDIVIHPRRSRIARTPLTLIATRPHQFIEVPGHQYEEKIEAFFTSNVINNTLFVHAIQRIPDLKSGFWNKPIKIPILTSITAEEHEAKWQTMKQAIRKGDFIFTFDSKSPASRIIAYLDQGTWSHTGFYNGNEMIAEAIVSGVVERSIEAYHDPRYRVGVYRQPSATPINIGRMDAFNRSQLGKRYNLLGALVLGARLTLGIWSSGRPGHTTPNILITRAGLELVALV
jgi:hypothetical protein